MKHTTRSRTFWEPDRERAAVAKYKVASLEQKSLSIQQTVCARNKKAQLRPHSPEDDTYRTTHKHNSKRGKARPRAKQKENAKVISTREGKYRVTNAKKKNRDSKTTQQCRTEDHAAAHVCKHMNLRVAPRSDVCDTETMKQSTMSGHEKKKTDMTAEHDVVNFSEEVTEAPAANHRSHSGTCVKAHGSTGLYHAVMLEVSSSKVPQSGTRSVLRKKKDRDESTAKEAVEKEEYRYTEAHSRSKWLKEEITKQQGHEGEQGEHRRSGERGKELKEREEQCQPLAEEQCQQQAKKNLRPVGVPLKEHDAKHLPEHREQDLIEGSERRTGEGLQQIQDRAGECCGQTSASNFDHEGDDQELCIPAEPNRHKATIKVDQSSRTETDLLGMTTRKTFEFKSQDLFVNEEKARTQKGHLDSGTGDVRCITETEDDAKNRSRTRSRTRRRVCQSRIEQWPKNFIDENTRNPTNGADGYD